MPIKKKSFHFNLIIDKLAVPSAELVPVVILDMMVSVAKFTD